MANREGDIIKAISNELRVTAGYFTTDGAGAVAAQVPAGTLARQGVFTVSKPAGTGIYQVLTDGYNECYWRGASVVSVAGTLDRTIDPISPITPTSGVFQFQVRKKSDGTAIDLVSQRVEFCIITKNSSVTP